MPSYPHARGGGPIGVRTTRPTRLVIPTHVGVDLRDHFGGLLFKRYPHARGGGPKTSLRLTLVHWVIPTHVGVNLTKDMEGDGWTSYPHARGGGPRPAGEGESLESLSPRTWGWTFVPRERNELTGVIPTHVGVDRQNAE